MRLAQRRLQVLVVGSGLVLLPLSWAPKAWSAPEKDEFTEEAPVEDEAEPPEPAPPKPGDQEPGPVAEARPPMGPARAIWLGAHAGAWSLSSESTTTSYGSAVAWGGFVRVSLMPWLGFRAYFLQATHPVSSTPPAPDSLDLTLVGASLEPTWQAAVNLRLWMGLGAAWAHVVADPIATEQLRIGQRLGSIIELSTSVGAGYEVIPNWLELSLQLSGGVITNESGTMFETAQATHRDRIDHVPPLAEYSVSFRGLVGLGLIL